MLQTVFPGFSLAATQGQVVQVGRWEGELIQTRRDGTPIAVASRWVYGGTTRVARGGAGDQHRHHRAEAGAGAHHLPGRPAGKLERCHLPADHELRITAWNHAAEAQYGWQAEEVMGLTPQMCSAPRSALSSAPQRRAMVETGCWQGEIQHRRRTARRSSWRPPVWRCGTRRDTSTPR